MGRFLDWLKADSAMGEVMRSRREEASALQDNLERCKSKLSTLKRNCPNFTPKEDEKMKAEDWIKVDRDKWGFLADGMMEQMYQNLPIIVWDSRDEMTEYIDQDNWYDWLSDLEGKPYYSHFLPIVLPKEESI